MQLIDFSTNPDNDVDVEIFGHSYNASQAGAVTNGELQLTQGIQNGMSAALTFAPADVAADFTARFDVYKQLASLSYGSDGGSETN